VLVHNKLDACVPYANTTQMANFFKEQGFKVDMEYTYNRYEDGKVFVFPITLPALSPKMGTHETGALPFIRPFPLSGRGIFPVSFWGQDCLWYLPPLMVNIEPVVAHPHPMFIVGTIFLNLACVCHFGFAFSERIRTFELGSNHNMA